MSKLTGIILHKRIHDILKAIDNAIWERVKLKAALTEWTPEKDQEIMDEAFQEVRDGLEMVEREMRRG